MRTSIHLPEGLAEVVKACLKEHPETNPSALVQEALEARLRGNARALEDRLYPREP